MSDHLKAPLDVLDSFMKESSLFLSHGVPLDPYMQNRMSAHWIYGSSNILESNFLENWRFLLTYDSAIAKMTAKIAINKWKKHLENEGNKLAMTYFKSPTAKRKTCYGDYANFNVPPPLEKESLLAYLIRMAEEPEKKWWDKPINERAFRCFLDYWRQRGEVAAGFIEHIFPKRMELYYGMVIRNITPESYPLSQEHAAEVLMDVARRCFQGRQDVRLTYLEVLGMLRICLTAARLKLPVQFEDLITLSPTSLVIQKNGLTSTVPSKTHRDTILQRPLRTLTRQLDNVLKSLNIDPAMGNITYQTFMREPHHFGPHRYQRK